MFVPLIEKVPPAVAIGKVMLALLITDVAGTVAALPWIFAGESGPTSGLDAKMVGSSRFDPGTPVFVSTVTGWLGRLALYWICEVCWPNQVGAELQRLRMLPEDCPWWDRAEFPSGNSPNRSPCSRSGRAENRRAACRG